MKHIIDIHKKLRAEILSLIALINVIWLAVFFMNYVNTSKFELSNLLYGLLFSTILGYIVFILIIACVLVFSVTPIRIKIIMKNPLIRKAPVVLLFVAVTLSSFSYDYTLYDKASLTEIINFSWIIFGLNITIFTFSYVFITNRLEVKNKENIKNENDAGTFFAKTNHNNEIHSRFATFTFITLNAFVLIISTFFILMLTSNDDVTKSNFMLSLIAFMLSTNTLILVLNDVSTEIQNKKKELVFEETLIKKENASILEIWKANKTLKGIIKNHKVIKENATNDEIKTLIEKLQVDPETIKFGNQKKTTKFFYLSLNVIKGHVEINNLFDKVAKFSDELSIDNIELLGEILQVQKQIRKKQKQVNLSIKKINKFKFTIKSIPPKR